MIFTNLTYVLLGFDRIFLDMVNGKSPRTTGSIKLLQLPSQLQQEMGATPNVSQLAPAKLPISLGNQKQNDSSPLL